METIPLPVRLDDWYAARRRGIGGSDAAVVLGVSPWKTPVRLYMEKRGETPEDDLASKQYVYWGIRLEDTIADEYARRTGRELNRVSRIAWSTEFPWMCCNVDRTVKGTAARVILEIKNVGLFQYVNSEWGDEGSNIVPPYYYSQAQHNCVVCKADQCDMPILIGGNEYRCYCIPRDDDFCRVLIAEERKFWEGVKNGVPPAPRNPDDALLLFPQAKEGLRIDCNDETIVESWRRYNRASELLRSLHATASEEKTKIMQFMGKAEYLEMNGEVIATWRRSRSGKRTFRSKALRELEPE